MATEFWYRSAGTYRKAKEIWYRSGGTWRKAKEVWYRSGGVWRKVFAAIGVLNPLPDVNRQRTVVGGGNATASISWQSNGQITGQGIPNTTVNWFDGTPDATYYLRLTYTGSPVGLTSGTWYALSTTRTASLTQSGLSPGEKTASGTYDISTSASTGGIIDSASFSITATTEP